MPGVDLPEIIYTKQSLGRLLPDTPRLLKVTFSSTGELAASIDGALIVGFGRNNANYNAIVARLRSAIADSVNRVVSASQVIGNVTDRKLVLTGHGLEMEPVLIETIELNDRDGKTTLELRNYIGPDLAKTDRYYVEITGCLCIIYAITTKSFGHNVGRGILPRNGIEDLLTILSD